MYKRIIPLFILLLLFLKANAETFTVINNNDNGVGSFREALSKAMANGNGEIDYVYFNIPNLSAGDRTIQLLTELPEITSDLVIDASTQPGADVSANGAKIIFDGTNFKFVSSSIQAFLKISKVNTFEIYGMVARNFFQIFPNGSSAISALYFKGQVNNVKIGAVGKGNVIYNMLGIGGNFNDPGIGSSLPNFILKNTYLGVHEDGIIIADKYVCTSQIYRLSKIVIGGDTKAEGNIIYGDFSSFVALPGTLLTVPFNLEIKNNIFYANKNEERPGIIGNSRNSAIGFSIDANFNHPSTSSIIVSDNVFGIGLSLGGFDNANILITRNSFGISKDKNKPLPIFTQALTLNNINGRVLVGGQLTEDGNVFSNTNNYKNYEWLFPGAVWSQKSSNVELSHNSFFCNPRMPYLIADTGPNAKPLDVFLDNVTSNSVSGRSKPGARIELFYSDPECTNCQPKRFFATVITDASGNWLYNGTFENGYAILAGATLNNISSEFSDPRIYLTNTGQTFKITNQTCDAPNGKIEGVNLVNVNHVEWLDEDGKVVGTNKDLVNVKAGNYRLKAYQFGCILYSDWATIGNNIPQLSAPAIPTIIHPACGGPGTILNLYPNYYKEYYWLDQSGRIVSRDRELKGAPAGSYSLRLVGLSDCVKDFGPYVLKNTSGPSLDFSNVKQTNTSCSSKTGSITGIATTGMGTITYKWINEKNAIVGTNIDLINVGAGTYKLEVRDQSSCGAIVSENYSIVEIGEITMDESLAKSNPTLCSVNSGSVKGVSINGLANYTWTDVSGKVISRNLDLENVGAGQYKLTATSPTGCIAISKTYSITGPEPTIYPAYNVYTADASCDLKNGNATISSSGLPMPANIKWTNESNTIISNTAVANNLEAGIYKIYFINDSGCETLYKTIRINQIPIMELNENAVSISSDNCGQGQGSITNLNLSGGIPPYAFSWTDVTNKIISTNGSAINLTSGVYYVNIKDQLNCQTLTKRFTVNNETQFLTAPNVEPISICAASTVNIVVTNKENKGIYKLYSAIENHKPMAISNNGLFKTEVSGSSTLFVSYAVGECESTKTAIIVETNGTELIIPKSFSPNGDGINDIWSIKNIYKYPFAITRIYNRMGAKVFEYIGENLSFDGTYKGTLLPSGVYYYTVLLSDNCNQISGSLTILY
ncbi:gliding motility-associated C-terminal domain-containing protein [Pedobacter sp. MC2016-05]|uniref:gliding motility-associated C-terminal domain-containing protein n=1 Tax=Pedobacter sp. MC2016-05 TaxID=2994474 RepID=UPI002247A6A1|nr:gliding motility-associated C-terminal domain-containing protein [Pedobacter sp. MC2016-05]MCX2475651.1 gliding motility-associated C-terminal domain-containing protein [Pedobacter sp. MC2016-05]